MNIIGGEDFTRTDTIARKILDKLADDELISRYAINLALKAGMEAGLIVLVPQEVSEFPHPSDMRPAEFQLYDPDVFGDTESGRTQNYLDFKLKRELDKFAGCEVSDALEATYRDGISIEDWEKAARHMLQEDEAEAA